MESRISGVGMKTHSESRSLSTISERTGTRRQLTRLQEEKSLTLDVIHLTIEVQVALLHAPVILEVFDLAKLVNAQSDMSST